MLFYLPCRTFRKPPNQAHVWWLLWRKPPPCRMVVSSELRWKHWSWRRQLWPGSDVHLWAGPRSLGQTFISHIIALQMISKTSSKSPFLYMIYISLKVFLRKLLFFENVTKYFRVHLIAFLLFVFQTIRHLHEINIFKSAFAAVSPCAILVLCLEHKNHFQSN